MCGRNTEGGAQRSMPSSFDLVRVAEGESATVTRLCYFHTPRIDHRQADECARVVLAPQSAISQALPMMALLNRRLLIFHS
jgi:hypothetical protein